MALAPNYIAEGDGFLEYKDFEFARSMHQKHVEAFPDEALGYLKLGHSHKLAEEHEAAIAFYRQALERDPQHLEALFNCAESLMWNGEYGESLELFERVDALAAPDAENLRSLLDEKRTLLQSKIAARQGAGFLKSEEWGAALEAYQRAIELNPTEPRHYLNAGVACLKQGDGDGGLDWFRRATEADPTYVRGHYNTAGLYKARGWWAHAKAVYERALEIEPDGRDSDDIRAGIAACDEGLAEARAALLALAQGETPQVASDEAAKLITAVSGEIVQSVDFAILGSGAMRLLGYGEGLLYIVTSQDGELSVLKDE